MPLPLLYYHGHCGPDAITPLASTGGAIQWNQPVKRVPEPEAASMVAHGGFSYTLPLSEAKTFKTTAKLLRKLGTVLSHKPSEGKPVDVVVITPELRRALATGESEE